MKSGITRSEYARLINSLIDKERDEAAQLMQKAAYWEGQAEAYENITLTRIFRSWLYYFESTGPSESGQQNAKICRENAETCRAQALQHSHKAAEFERQRDLFVAWGQFDGD